MRVGGGVSYLVGLLAAADPARDRFSRVIVWGGRRTLDAIQDRPWLEKSHQDSLDRSLPHRALWQRTQLARLARGSGCDVLFIPGGSYTGDFRPYVAISHNLLPFEAAERARYGASWMWLKLSLLRLVQGRTFRRADGMIFASEYARDVIENAVDLAGVPSALVPNAVDPAFVTPPRPQRESASPDRPFRIVYVSIVDVYKHQWQLARAVAALRDRGHHVRLDLYGAGYPPAMRKLSETLAAIPDAAGFITYHGRPPREQLIDAYRSADVFAYASSCENMPIIMLEAMAAGLPIASSNRGPMPEILGDAGVYFDPEDSADIARALETLLSSAALRSRNAAASFEWARSYTEERCARDSFAFLTSVAGGTTQPSNVR
jgi:glycosyltransferase involved in cell wall biosynthesis